MSSSTLQKEIKRTARYLAAETLHRLYESRLPVKTLIDQAALLSRLTPVDRSLFMQLVYGVLRHRGFLDRILEILSTTSIGKLDPFLHQILAVGLYQLFFLDRIPASAAVNEMVECCKARRLPQRLNGFVNGILRQAARRKSELLVKAEFSKEGAPITNHPEWLVKRWRQHYGEDEARRICVVNNGEPTLVLRTNLARCTREELRQNLENAGIIAHPGNYAEEALILPEYQGPIGSLPGYAEGLFQVQDEAAQLVTNLLAPFQAGGRYLDACAGLGGKTTHLLQLATTYHLEITAIEPESYRLKKLGENIARTAPGGKIRILPTSLQEAAQQGLTPFHGILIDAPCSGTGVIGRHPDIRWNRRPEDLLKYQKEQLDLLSVGSTLLKPGGILVYATCSLEPEENREVVNLFLRDNSGFFLTDCTPYLPKAAHRLVIDHCFAPRPDATIDGFFAARLERRKTA